MRVFLAVDLPAEVVREVTGLPRPEDRRVRWTTADQWHVTLRFLGELEPVVLEGPGGLVAALDGLPEASGLAGALPVQAAMGPASAWFPGRRVLQVPVEGLEVLARCVVETTARWGAPSRPALPRAPHSGPGQGPGQGAGGARRGGRRGPLGRARGGALPLGRGSGRAPLRGLAPGGARRLTSARAGPVRAGRKSTANRCSGITVT